MLYRRAFRFSAQCGLRTAARRAEMTHVSEQSTTFNPETLHILGSALDDAWQRLDLEVRVHRLVAAMPSARCLLSTLSLWLNKASATVITRDQPKGGRPNPERHHDTPRPICERRQGHDDNCGGWVRDRGGWESAQTRGSAQHYLVGDYLEARESARAERGHDRDVGRIAAARHQDAADARLVVTGIERVPVAA